MDKTAQSKTTYNVRDIAELLGICLPAAYELCNRKDFPAIRVTPRRIIIPVDGLQRWLEEQSGVGKKEG
ncbi:MAG: helix-turn-helix domain-containing protein [Oscillospiraceae bacterium]